MSPEGGAPETRSSDPLHDLDLLLRSRYALVLLETAEVDRAESLLLHLADRLGIPLFAWTASKGLKRSDKPTSIYDTADPAKALAHVESARFPALYVFRGLEDRLEDTTLQQRLVDASQPYHAVTGAIVLVGTGIALAEPHRPHAARVRLPPPDVEEYRALLMHIVRDLNSRGRVEIDQTPEETNQLLGALRGLTLLEAEKILTKAMVEDDRLSPEDIRTVVEAKRHLIEREGLLEYYPLEESMDEVADLATLKEWLRKRQAIVSTPERAAEFGLEFPKGVLLLGVPGCGKSLCAKAVAMEWRLPLLKLDPSNLYNKFIGESEKNFKRAVATAERMSPVILWIDELEKAFAGAGDNDGGVTQRILGTFLSWLQDRRGDVFVVATANDVSRLPAEFLRKGRFDEVFFVDLPDEETRREIFRIHLEKRSQDPAAFDLAELAGRANGFSGSEIEQAVVAALYTAFSESAALTGDALAAEIDGTSPLSRMMSEKVDALRAWAEGRTVRAN
ncbi:MAG: AAA family ATPase [Gemmatimonadota bacterium]|nr:AAA family ATPase [Gemmatimonadota bacterium]